MTKVGKTKREDEEFPVEKLKGSIKKVAIDAGRKMDDTQTAIEYIARSTAPMAQSMDILDSFELRDDVLDSLKNDNKKVADAWRRFDRRFKQFRTDNRHIRYIRTEDERNLSQRQGNIGERGA